MLRIITYEDYKLFEKIIRKQNDVIEENEYIYHHKGKQLHDKLFKDLLADEEEIRYFLTHFVNIGSLIKGRCLQKYKSSYITKQYQVREADVVYKLHDKNIFILIEQQSKVDYTMPFRMLRYSVEIMQDAIEEEKAKENTYQYPNIIPIVLYTGRQKWKVKEKLSEIQEDLKPYRVKRSMEMQYNLVNIYQYTMQELLDNEYLLPKMMAVERCKTKEEVLELIKQIMEKLEKDTQKEKLERILEYLLMELLGKDEVRNIIEAMKKKEVGIDMLSENLLLERRNVERKSRREGIKEGMLQAKENIFQNMILLGETEEKIAQILGETVEEIRKRKRKF